MTYPPLLIVSQNFEDPPRSGATAKVVGLTRAWPGPVAVVCPDPPASDAVRFYEMSVAPARSSSRAVLRSVPPVSQLVDAEQTAATVLEVASQMGPDTITHFDLIGLAPLAQAMGRTPLRNHRRVLSVNDSYELIVRGRGSSRLREIAVARYARLVERRLLSSSPLVHVVSPIDQVHLCRLVPRANVQLVPLGISSPFTRPEDRPAPVIDVGVIGKWQGSAERDLQWIVNDLTPRLGAAVTVTVAGPTSGASRRLLDDGEIAYLGEVNSSTEFLGSCRVALVPSDRRSGTPTKAIEAMSMGVPVVGRGALDGVPGAVDGVHFVRSSDLETLANAIIALSDGGPKAQRLGSEGQVLSTQHSWPAVVKTYLESVRSSQ